MNCGVYKITNKLTGKIYIGASKGVTRRLYLHRWQLRRGEHHSVTLQRAWDKYGAEAFEFEPILYCAPETLRLYEQTAMDFYQSYDRDKGYNIAKFSEHPTRGRVWTQEERKAASERKLGKAVFRDNPVAMANLMKTIKRGPEHHMYGKTHTEEAKRRMSEGLGGQTAHNKGKPSDRKGVSRSAETVRKIRDARRSQGQPTQILDEDKVRLIRKMKTEDRCSYKMLAETFGVSIPTIASVLCGKTWRNVT